MTVADVDATIEAALASGGQVVNNDGRSVADISDPGGNTREIAEAS
ncbi:MAG: hypothetical protein GY926_03275 [bacterium]|nr:hypothetical protein [bacterium]MCP4964236.1 hypothetical protein [bacterium]